MFAAIQASFKVSEYTGAVFSEDPMIPRGTSSPFDGASVMELDSEVLVLEENFLNNFGVGIALDGEERRTARP